MSVHGAGTTLQFTAVDIVWLLTTTIFYLKCLDEGTILQLLLKTGNSKALWNTFKKILHKSSTIILPNHVNHDLANSFGHFFSDKVMKIRTALQSLVPVSVLAISFKPMTRKCT